MRYSSEPYTDRMREIRDNDLAIGFIQVEHADLIVALLNEASGTEDGTVTIRLSVDPDNDDAVTIGAQFDPILDTELEYDDLPAHHRIGVTMLMAGGAMGDTDVVATEREEKDA